MKKLASAAIILALLGILIFISAGQNQNYPDYTVFSANERGVSVFYETLEHMGYPVKAGFNYLSSGSSIHDIHILVMPYYYYQDYAFDDMMDWVKKGGRLIFLDWNTPTAVDHYMGWEGKYDGFRRQKYGTGEIVIGTVESVLNYSLLTEHQDIEFLLGAIDKWGFETIIFDEYYHGYQDEANLWRDLPGYFKTLIYQLCIAAILIVFMLGKRFGKPIPYYEEIERGENEYLRALSGIYKKTGMGSVIMENAYISFVQNAAGYFGVSEANATENIVELWKSRNLPDGELLNRLLAAKNKDFNTNKKKQRKELFRALSYIKKLNNHIDKEWLDA